MFGLGWPEVGVILGVVLLIFGPKQIPAMGAALGRTLRSFQEGMGQSDADSAD